MSNKLRAALRQKYRTPQEALRTLGLDENLISEDLMDNRDLAKKLNALSARQVSIGALATYLHPRLAQDAKLDIPAIFEGVKVGQDFKNQKIKIAERIRAQTKGKLAKDATLEQVEQVLDMLDGHEIEASEGTDESVSKEQHNAMAAAAHGASNLDIPAKVGQEFIDKDKGKSFDAEPVMNFLRERGMSEDDLTHVQGMFPPKPATDESEESEEEKRKREEEEKKTAGDKDPIPSFTKEESPPGSEAKKAGAMDKAPVTKQAMDKAIKDAVEATRASVLKTSQEIREALAEVRPYVGTLPASIAFDSAESVRRHALTMLKVPNAKTMHVDALAAVLAVQTKPGESRHIAQDQDLGLDSAGAEDFKSRFPGADRIRAA